jgi:hypothetical protein
MANVKSTARIIPTAALRGSKSEFRAGAGWVESTQLERAALVMLRRVFTNRLTDTAAEAWMAQFPNAMGSATRTEAQMLRMADCAVEVG